MSESKIKIQKAQDLICQKLKYTFVNADLLLEAITHKSISKINYERLEFLGDAVLQLVISKHLFVSYPDYREGYLSREKQNLVSKKIISKISINMKLLDILRSNNLDIKSNIALRDSLAADIFESLIGAIFLDSNYSQCEIIILDIFSGYLTKTNIIGKKDAKTRLQEYLQSHGLPLPKYVTTKISGPAHNPKFKITCSIKNYQSSEHVISKTVQSGQQEVSQIFLNKIKNEKNV
tara:strand:+ start:56 stop:760 length:705 start_codon:yes stop_codon:yes gene_type:complete